LDAIIPLRGSLLPANLQSRTFLTEVACQRPPARCCDASCIQGFGDVSQCVRACSLSILDEGQNVRGVPVGIRLDDHLGGLTGLGKLRAAQHAPSDQVALLLTEGGIQVQNERINIRAQLCHDEWDLVGH
jgi:hypothetical protein